MRRREFILLLVATAAWPRTVTAQSPSKVGPQYRRWNDMSQGPQATGTEDPYLRRQQEQDKATLERSYDGRRALLHLMAGSKEDAETVIAFFEDIKGRGLNDPLLVTSDGAPGVIKAIEVCFP